MSDKNRIRLALAIGFTREHSGIKNDPFPYMWREPSGDIYGPTFNESGCPFFPFTDANDCEALITWLNGRCWRVNINIELGGHSVKVWRFKSPDTKEYVWEGSDWKQCVCELALKVLDNE